MVALRCWAGVCEQLPCHRARVQAPRSAAPGQVTSLQMLTALGRKPRADLGFTSPEMRAWVLKRYLHVIIIINVGTYAQQVQQQKQAVTAGGCHISHIFFFFFLHIWADIYIF